MCGRFAQILPPEAIEQLFSVRIPWNLQPRYNLAPTQDALTIFSEEDGARAARMMRWGLIPSWAKEESIGNRLINARSETAAEKPSLRAAFKRRRCLIPADGFYEWRKMKDGKQPYRIKDPDDQPLVLAGLWEDSETFDVVTFTILTTEANDTLKDLHNRMPVILPQEAWAYWLDPHLEGKEAQEFLVPYDGALEIYPVSRDVNRPSFDDPACLDAVEVKD